MVDPHVYLTYQAKGVDSMILATEELMDIIEPALAMKLGKEVEVYDFKDMKISFAVHSSDDKWIEGYVKVDYYTDLAVYIERSDGYIYAGDINWCDILPEGIE
jgi:hypothetical protein